MKRSKKKLHSAVFIVLPGDRVLLQFRDEHTNWYPLSFSAWGGSTEAGETSRACAAREVAEELDMVVHEREFEYLGRHETDDMIQDLYMLRSDIRLADIRLGEGAGFACVPILEVRSILPMNDLLMRDLDLLSQRLSKP